MFPIHRVDTDSCSFCNPVVPANTDHLFILFLGGCTSLTFLSLSSPLFSLFLSRFCQLFVSLCLFSLTSWLRLSYSVTFSYLLTYSLVNAHKYTTFQAIICVAMQVVTFLTVATAQWLFDKTPPHILALCKSSLSCSSSPFLSFPFLSCNGIHKTAYIWPHTVRAKYSSRNSAVSIRTTAHLQSVQAPPAQKRRFPFLTPDYRIRRVKGHKSSFSDASVVTDGPYCVQDMEMRAQTCFIDLDSQDSFISSAV